MKNETMMHGLFGKLYPGEMQEFEMWKEPARYVRELSKQNINIYRSIISFKRDTANELGLFAQKDWQRYIETHIGAIAQANNIKIQNLGFVCAVHNEKSHPHIHVVFCDKGQEVQKNFIPKEIPNKIRKQLIKDTFGDRIKEYCKQKDKGKTQIQEVTDEMVSEFEMYIKKLYPKAYDEYRRLFETYDEDSIVSSSAACLNPQNIDTLAESFFKLRDSMPKSGRIAYKLLPQNAKIEVDNFTIQLLNSSSALRQSVKLYVDGKMNIAMLYSGNKKYLSSQRKQFQKEAEKIIANRILSILKAVLKKEKEIEYTKIQKQYFTEQLLIGVLDLLGRKIIANERRLGDLKDKVISTELSKQAKREYYLKNKDKGLET